MRDRDIVHFNVSKNNTPTKIRSIKLEHFAGKEKYTGNKLSQKKNKLESIIVNRHVQLKIMSLALETIGEGARD